jgi:hypothetical protein
LAAIPVRVQKSKLQLRNRLNLKPVKAFFKRSAEKKK